MPNGGFAPRPISVGAILRYTSSVEKFWQSVPLEDMTRAQWESLCDGCGRCCLHKLRDEDTERVHHTKVACRLLNTATARCNDYANRKARVPDCIRLTPFKLRKIDWLPPTCAYRLVAGRVGALRTHNLVVTGASHARSQGEHRAFITALAKGELASAEDILSEHIWRMRLAYRATLARRESGPS